MGLDIPTKVHKTQAKHQRLYTELLAVFKKHGADKSADELLAIASNIVGKLIALQDQRTMTTEAAMTIVRENIEMGNSEAILELHKSAGHG